MTGGSAEVSPLNDGLTEMMSMPSVWPRRRLSRRFGRDSAYVVGLAEVRSLDGVLAEMVFR